MSIYWGFFVRFYIGRNYFIMVIIVEVLFICSSGRGMLIFEMILESLKVFGFICLS